MTSPDCRWGFWSASEAWIVLVVHASDGWSVPPPRPHRNSDWYDCGFLVGAGSPLLGAAGGGARRGARRGGAGTAAGAPPYARRPAA
jgi:hypothetical protein